MCLATCASLSFNSVGSLMVVVDMLFPGTNWVVTGSVDQLCYIVKFVVKGRFLTQSDASVIDEQGQNLE